MENFGAITELRNVLQAELRGEVVPVVDLIAYKGKNVGTATQVLLPSTTYFSITPC